MLNDQAQMEAILASLARHGLTAFGGMLIHHGYLQSSQMADFVGAGMLLVGIGWSWWNKHGQAVVAAELAKMKAAAPAPAVKP